MWIGACVADGGTADRANAEGFTRRIDMTAADCRQAQAISSAPRAGTAGEAVLVLEDGTTIRGKGLGAFGQALGEVCFNTSMTGYQEILTDPSYAGQIITFTFPHIGNVGTNEEDVESAPPTCRGLVLRED